MLPLTLFLLLQSPVESPRPAPPVVAAEDDPRFLERLAVKLADHPKLRERNRQDFADELKAAADEWKKHPEKLAEDDDTPKMGFGGFAIGTVIAYAVKAILQAILITVIGKILWAHAGMVALCVIGFLFAIGFVSFVSGWLGARLGRAKA